ncbi:S_locus_glycop domain-containing protein/B_lectin domain-containing protein/PAN_2 domain-containing protein [Cephalotus follicularis]|uniref:non-specific serine/threonine protein kinase n=1 Tax=Cephalotus follicularis TaxID=3775 RepID=A0A1Q3CUV5_CEPFO|nr:S_locus_glycop domain-containing protein/B_lectin domain-containing protein/PAN_2 domain-containing protein [Cephalotus follicularis]
MYPVKWSLNVCPLFLIFQFCTSIDTITPNFSLKNGDELVSRGNIFTLGFFSAGNSKNRYIGIWYYQVPYQTVVWVENRNNPINDTSGVLAIDDHGNLVLFEHYRTLYVEQSEPSMDQDLVRSTEDCDYYGHCGVNSNCEQTNVGNLECTCLPGFEPNSSQEWILRDGSGGCVRKAGVSSCTSGEGFVKLPRVKVPDTSMAGVDMSLGLKECEEKCLRNCSCMAYASAYYEGNKGGVGCLTRYGDLVDARTYSNFGQEIYVRVDANQSGICLFCVFMVVSKSFNILGHACSLAFHEYLLRLHA